MGNGKVFIANDFITLKNKIKEEVKRRKYIGSVATYGEPRYDYVEIPAPFETLKAEHVDKISECVSAINDTNIKRNYDNGDTVTHMAIMDAEVARFEAAPKVGVNSGCKASCTGLCSTTCTGTCTSGCSGSCSGSCSGCSGCSGCGGSCSYGCSGSCSGCGGSCGGKCSTSCSSYCGGTCTGAEFCSGGCSGCCTGCSSTCHRNCSGSLDNG